MGKLKISKHELILYTFSIILFLTGFVFTLLGVIGSHLSPDNKIAEAEKSFYSFRYFGLILLSAGSILISFTFLFFARDAERKSEREERRKQRLQMAEQIEKDAPNIDENFENKSITQKDAKDTENTPLAEIKKDNPDSNK